MAVEERHRRQLQEALVEQIGPGPADTLMEYLPPVGWADVATKQDLNALRAATKQDVAMVRQDLGALRAATKQDLNALQAVMHAEINELGADLRTEFHREMSALNASLQTALRTQFYWTVTVMVLLMTAFVAALKLV